MTAPKTKAELQQQRNKVRTQKFSSQIPGGVEAASETSINSY
jgi:hypothetical protein